MLFLLAVALLACSGCAGSTRAEKNAVISVPVNTIQATGAGPETAVRDLTECPEGMQEMIAQARGIVCLCRFPGTLAHRAEAVFPRSSMVQNLEKLGYRCRAGKPCLCYRVTLQPGTSAEELEQELAGKLHTRSLLPFTVTRYPSEESFDLNYDAGFE